jgi:hypothetical protein
MRSSRKIAEAESGFMAVVIPGLRDRKRPDTRPASVTKCRDREAHGPSLISAARIHGMARATSLTPAII